MKRKAPLSTQVVYKGEPKLTRKPIRQPKQQEKNLRPRETNHKNPPRHTIVHHMGPAFPTFKITLTHSKILGLNPQNTN
jgi:hypothetical protein